MVKEGVGNNDLLCLNFGGERTIQVKRSLLLQFEDSMLAAMFSGRYEEQLERDQEGNIFLDYSPGVMMPLIEFLRRRRDACESNRTPLPEVPQSERSAWNVMVDFFGLS